MKMDKIEVDRGHLLTRFVNRLFLVDLVFDLATFITPAKKNETKINVAPESVVVLRTMAVLGVTQLFNATLIYVRCIK